MSLYEEGLSGARAGAGGEGVEGDEAEGAAGVEPACAARPVEAGESGEVTPMVSEWVVEVVFDPVEDLEGSRKWARTRHAEASSVFGEGIEGAHGEGESLVVR